MRRSTAVLIGLSTLAILAVAPASAKTIYRDVATFTQMQKLVEKIHDPEATLVVMDDDDTLTMMSCPDQTKPKTCQYLGGAAWYAWQQRQIDRMAQPRVANTFDELLTAAALIFDMNDMPFTAEDVPDVLEQLAKSGVRLLVETARGNENVSATERQFSDLPVSAKDAKNLQKLLERHSLTFGPAALPSKASPYVPCADEPGDPKTPAEDFKAITFQNGTMYLAGQNKGDILRCTLRGYNASQGARPIRHVVFIDDTLKNVEKVQSAFDSVPEIDGYALLYTALQAHKLALTEGPMAETYQANAMKRWKAIKAALEHEIQNPILP